MYSNNKCLLPTEGDVFVTPALAGLPILLGPLSPLGFDVLIVALKWSV